MTSKIEDTKALQLLNTAINKAVNEKAEFQNSASDIINYLKEQDKYSAELASAMVHTSDALQTIQFNISQTVAHLEEVIGVSMQELSTDLETANAIGSNLKLILGYSPETVADIIESVDVSIIHAAALLVSPDTLLIWHDYIRRVLVAQGKIDAEGEI